MRTLARLALAGAVAGTVLLAPPAQAGPPCWDSPCYECVTYPCHPGDWVELVCDRVVANCP